jgi:hypothetical protein
MKQSKIHYLVLATIFILSFIIVLSLPSDFWKGIAATPAIGALIAGLFQYFRDQAAFERQLELQRKQHIFNLGAASHMANIAFDKHVEFCEKYMAEVHETIDTLFIKGPTRTATEHFNSLSKIHREYSAWIPKKVASQLKPFENAINEIGTTSGYAEDTGDPGAIRQKYDLLKKVLGLDDIQAGDSENKNIIAQENVKEKVRSILGINELTEIRLLIIKKSLDFIAKSS